MAQSGAYVSVSGGEQTHENLETGSVALGQVSKCSGFQMMPLCEVRVIATCRIIRGVDKNSVFKGPQYVQGTVPKFR